MSVCIFCASVCLYFTYLSMTNEIVFVARYRFGCILRRSGVRLFVGRLATYASKRFATIITSCFGGCLRFFLIIRFHLTLFLACAGNRIRDLYIIAVLQ